MQNKGVGCLAIFLAVALIISVGINLLQLAAWFGMDEAAMGIVQPKTKFGEHLIESGEKDTKDKIVQISLDGMITSGTDSGLLGSVGMDVDNVKRALEQAIEDYLRTHNEKARPFVWTKDADLILAKVRRACERLAPPAN